ncbi:MAG: polyprenol monophosphomannose synthase [bacterium]|nr:polyprenol monophosphomannose synthase [bacterium]
MKTLIIIPTYNECQNIERLITTIFSLPVSVSILIIDDNSPDKTYEIVQTLQHKFTSLFIIKRKTKSGLGTAYLKGFEFALKKGYDNIIQMDADFSHPPETIPLFLNHIKTNDVVIGSRYIKHGKIKNWPLSRRLLSRYANIFVSFILGFPIKDATSGFKCYKLKALQAIELNKIKSNGYSFQIETIYKAWCQNFRLKEIPITFTERVLGESKISKSIIWEAFWLVWKLKTGLLK